MRAKPVAVASQERLHPRHRAGSRSPLLVSLATARLHCPASCRNANPTVTATRQDFMQPLKANSVNRHRFGRSVPGQHNSCFPAGLADEWPDVWAQSAVLVAVENLMKDGCRFRARSIIKKKTAFSTVCQPHSTPPRWLPVTPEDGLEPRVWRCFSCATAR